MVHRNTYDSVKPSAEHAPPFEQCNYIASYSVVTILTLHKMGYTTASIVDELLKMDYETLSGLDEHHAGRLEQWVPVVDNNPDGIRILMNENRQIVGYWHFVALSPSFFDRAKLGQLFDEEITTSSMRILGFPGLYKAYFVGISVLADHRGYKSMRLLFESFCDTLEELAMGGLFFEELCACAFTDQGIALCESMGMSRICSHEDHGEIYWADMKNILSPFRRDKSLTKLYDVQFNQARP